MNNKILELKNIKREFKMGSETVRALKDISFEVAIRGICYYHGCQRIRENHSA